MSLCHSERSEESIYRHHRCSGHHPWDRSNFHCPHQRTGDLPCGGCRGQAGQRYGFGGCRVHHSLRLRLCLRRGAVGRGACVCVPFPPQLHRGGQRGDIHPCFGVYRGRACPAAACRRRPLCRARGIYPACLSERKDGFNSGRGGCRRHCIQHFRFAPRGDEPVEAPRN